MKRFKPGLLILALLAPAIPVLADHTEKGKMHGNNQRSPSDIQSMLNGARVALPDAIRTGEQATKGKCFDAELVTWECVSSKIDSSKVKDRNFHSDHPMIKVLCLADGRIVEAIVCAKTNQVVDVHECRRDAQSADRASTMDGAFPNNSQGGVTQSDGKSATIPEGQRGGISTVSGGLASTGSTNASGSDDRNSPWFRSVSRWQKATDIIGKPITAQATHEKIGNVKEIVVDPDGSRATYFIAEFDDKMGHGNRWFSIPLGAMRLADDYKSVVFDYSTTKVNQIDGFDENHWPNMTDETRAAKVYKAVGVEPYWATQNDQNIQGTDGNTQTTAIDYDSGRRSPTRWMKAKDLIGKEVRDNQNANLGNLKEIVIDADSGRILYGVLSFGGVLGLGDKLFAIPWRSIELNSDGKTLVLGVDKNRLKESDGFDKNHWPNVADERWAAAVHDYYGRPRYWESAKR